MPERVVTIDVEQMLEGDAVLVSATLRPYNPELLPGVWAGGHYVDAIIEAEGFGDFGGLAADAHELTGPMPARLLDGGVGHTFLGWPRPATLPPSPDTGRRRAVVTLDLGNTIGAVVRKAEVLPVTASSRALEALVDTRGGGASNGSTLHAEVWDALDDHPARLRQALERRGTGRRQRSNDPPTPWENRRGGQP